MTSDTDHQLFQEEGTKGILEFLADSPDQFGTWAAITIIQQNIGILRRSHTILHLSLVLPLGTRVTSLARSPPAVRVPRLVSRWSVDAVIVILKAPPRYRWPNLEAASLTERPMRRCPTINDDAEPRGNPGTHD